MGYDLFNRNDDHLQMRGIGFRDLYAIAALHGWRAMGTLPPDGEGRAGETRSYQVLEMRGLPRLISYFRLGLAKISGRGKAVWDRQNYFTNDGQWVTGEDAANWAIALGTARGALGPKMGEFFSDEFLDEFVTYCRKGGFKIH